MTIHRTYQKVALLAAMLVPVVAWGASEDKDAQSPTQLLWGDTHLHTNISGDAFMNGNLSVTPADAYRFAMGEPVIHPYSRVRVQIGTPLDFLVIADHAEFLGGVKDIYFTGVSLEEPTLIERLVSWFTERQIREIVDSGEGPAFVEDSLPVPGDPREAARRYGENAPDLPPGADIYARNAWHDLLDTADGYNEPGKFTAFAGWEWSSMPGNANLHRVVVSNANRKTGRRFLPFSSNDSPFPEDLWQWLYMTGKESEVRCLRIPHNSNTSRGVMFDTRTLRGVAVSRQYAEQRQRIEPIVEVTQIKGDSETHPSLSPQDEFAEFESYAYYLSAQSSERESYTARPGDYVRSALKTGMQLEQQVGVNPYKLGMIGSTDSHTGLATAEEPNFWGKFAIDSIPENKTGGALGLATGWSMSASGLAAVWATENTRDAIMDAMFRREVYATTGTRIRVRFFGGWNFSEADLPTLPNSGYEKGVPMGSTLPGIGTAVSAPTFLIQAFRDPVGDNLDRIQIIKGWVNARGEALERIYDVAWSDDRKRDADTGRLPALMDRVDRKTGKNLSDQGEPELVTAWTDPEFNPSQPAFYYARILQVPTARHSLLDRIALGVERAEDYPDVIQERAYTSPIWYTPKP